MSIPGWWCTLQYYIQYPYGKKMFLRDVLQFVLWNNDETLEYITYKARMKQQLQKFVIINYPLARVILSLQHFHNGDAWQNIMLLIYGRI